VFSAPADANSIGDGSWSIDNAFREAIGGNAAFAVAARERQAGQLLRLVRRELHAGNGSARDLFGSLQRIKLAIDSLHTHRTIQIIVLSDGGPNRPRHVLDVYDAARHGRAPQRVARDALEAR